ncbi:PepSY-associated TM helix domain-containing protein [Segatella bryantii]
MKAKIFFRKQHKWIGIVVCLFILLFCISGIILNHRKAFGNVNVPRSWVPEQF